MKHRILLAALASYVLTSTLPSFAAPPLINYQGRIVVGTTNFNSPPNGLFKFALVNADGTASYWSNTATTPFPTEPTVAVSLPVTKGLYSVLLGDTTIPNMIAIPTSAFTAPDLRLRVWFSDGTNGFQQLTPDQRLAPTAYLADGVVGSANIADASIISSKVAPGAITGTQIAPNSLVAGNFAAGATAGQVLGYNGTTLNWITPGGSTPTSGWALGGNGGTTAANFLGTTDSQNLIFKTTNLERLRLTTGGEVLLQKPDSFPAFSVRNGLGVYGVSSAFDEVGRFFAGANILGPVLYGQSGGGLGVKSATNVEMLALRWDSTGNVGIGISTPSSRLHVQSAGPTEALIRSTDDRAILTLDGFPPGAGVRSVFTLESGVNGAPGVFGIYDRNAGAVRLSINAGGRVGIGTMLPSGTLDVRSSGVTNAIYSIASGNGDAVNGLSADGNGVNARSTNGTGLVASCPQGRAIYAEGHTAQSRTFGGMVKAMIHFNSSGTILRGFNSFLTGTAATTVPCGFAVTLQQGFGSGYVIDFGFQVSDRFVSITPSPAAVSYGQNGSGVSDPNKIHFFADPSTGAGYTIIVY